jgi:phosphoribosyl 1,2-cyclic phosphate phosphodiesterase
MIITFLGTSAANAYPEAFCMCDNCIRARALGGPSLRKRSSILINNGMLVDLGPDIMAASQMHGISLVSVRYCLQTHPHADHLDLSHLNSRSPGYGVIGAPCLDFYASRETLKRADETYIRDLGNSSLFAPETENRLNLKIHQVDPLEAFTCGSYRVTPFPANHAPGMEAMLYAVEQANSSIFYGTDTAALPAETWQAFKQYKMNFDIVILDHTYGPEQEGSDHLCARQLIEHAARMRKEGFLKPNARIFATHIAHEGNQPHPDLTVFGGKNGYEIAFDGLVVDV